MAGKRRIREFTVRNFKSHAETTVKLGDFNVFIGENGAGKSNLLDSLLAVSDLQLEAVSPVFKPPRRSYFGECYRREGRGDMEFEIEFVAKTRGYRYSLVLEPFSDYQSAIVSKETLCDVETGDNLLQTEYGKGKALDVSDGVKRGVDYSTDSVVLARLQDRSKFPWAVEAHGFLSSMRRFHFDPDTMRLPSKVDPSANLGEKGETVAAVFDRMEREVQDAVNGIMSSSGPDISRMEARASYGGTKVVAARETWDPTPFHADQISDGVLRFLGLVMLAHGGTDAGVCLVEEPENGLNPRRYVGLVDLYRSAAAQGGPQFLLATHSVVFVDHLEEGELYHVSKEKGASLVKRVSDIPGFGDRWRAFDGPLGETWFAGLIEE